jgi:diaminohydroxyphosphoribosylaminopyrimidine deaminase/5-amino-6-(5-phosphoribosylamino)uracil reductase
MIHSDADFMKHCFYLAEKGRGMTSPNPLVGCVIVQNDEIVATGYHRKAGLAHAELDAIENTQANLKGATLYCNLEPCCHTNKKTPPCAQRIILETYQQSCHC